VGQDFLKNYSAKHCALLAKSIQSRNLTLALDEKLIADTPQNANKLLILLNFLPVKSLGIL
jgi:hypothetical protein